MYEDILRKACDENNCSLLLYSLIPGGGDINIAEKEALIHITDCTLKSGLKSFAEVIHFGLKREGLGRGSEYLEEVGVSEEMARGATQILLAISPTWKKHLISILGNDELWALAEVDRGDPMFMKRLRLGVEKGSEEFEIYETSSLTYLCSRIRDHRTGRFIIKMPSNQETFMKAINSMRYEMEDRRHHPGRVEIWGEGDASLLIEKGFALNEFLSVFREGAALSGVLPKMKPRRL